MYALSCNRIGRAAFAVVIAMLLLSLPAAASQIWVDDDAPADPGPGDPAVSDPLEDGSPGHPFDSIQESIDVALTGDIIVVAPGVYRERINFLGKAVSVMSTGDSPTNTIIDATGLGGSVVTCMTYETSATLLDGFTVTGGTGTLLPYEDYTRGGGLIAEYSSPTIRNCIFTGNTAEEGGAVATMWDGVPLIVNCTFAENTATRGGALYCDWDGPTLLQCTFSRNSASDGGAAYIEYAGLSFTNCDFVANSATNGGGGIYNDDSYPTLDNCSFSENTAAVGAAMYIDTYATWTTVAHCTFSLNTATNGGALAISHSSGLTVSDCLFELNHAGGEGGAVRAYHSDIILANCTFDSNSAALGGALYLFNYEPQVRNCIFQGNTATSDGGAIWSRWLDGGTLTGCTIVGNQAVRGAALACDWLNVGFTVNNCRLLGNGASSMGGGVYVNWDSSLTFQNCEFGGNGAATSGGGFCVVDSIVELNNVTLSGNAAPQGQALKLLSASTATLRNSVIWNGGSEVQKDAASTVTFSYCDIDDDAYGGTGVLYSDPLFSDPLGADGVAGTEDDDLRLSGASPCIDAGSNLLVGPDVADLDGDGDLIERTPFDLFGEPRFVDDPAVADTGQADPPLYPGVVDLGAGEYQSPPGPPQISASDGAYVEFVLVAWPPVLLADDYRVFRCISAQPELAEPISEWQTVAFLQDTAVEVGAVYWYWVVARNEHGQTWSAGDSGFLCSQPPPAPENLQASDGDYVARVLLTWAPCTMADGYRVYRSTSDDPSTAGLISDWIPDAATDDLFLDPHVTYWYWVQTRNVYGLSDWGTPDSGWTRASGRVYVDAAADSGNRGTSWQDAYADLQDALSVGPALQEIWMAAGTYTPDRGTGDRAASFQLRDGVTLFGGFAGRESILVQRDLTGPSTLLSGDLDGDDELGQDSNSENSYHVVTATDCGAAAVLDGVTIRAGNADGSGNDGCGGGVYIVRGSPILRNCRVIDNTARWGGGIYTTNTAATFASCLIKHNSATWNYGGGMANDAGAPSLANCTIVDNTSAAGAAGVYSPGSAPVFTSSILWGNVGPTGTSEWNQLGGGDPELSYCTVQGWTGALGGTGNDGADPRFLAPESGDYCLDPESLAIDSGEPALDPTAGETDLDGLARVWDGDADGTWRVDRGAFEFSARHTGDANCDGLINVFDIDAFVLVLTDPAAYFAAWPECSLIVADCNADGLVNAFDIDPFVLLLTGG